MKRLIDFLLTTALGGLFVLLPVLLLYLLVAEALPLVIALATPIADLFPKGMFDEVKAPVVIALILIVGASFLVGLALRSRALRRIGGWINQNALGRLPVYNALKALTKGFAGTEEAEAFRPALIISEGGEQEVVYVIEDHGDGLLTVLVPWSPAAFAGSVKIVDRDRIKMLNASLDQASRTLTHWGVGVQDLLGKSTESNGPTLGRTTDVLDKGAGK
jgi:uncharacterized membrane protein